MPVPVHATTVAPATAPPAHAPVQTMPTTAHNVNYVHVQHTTIAPDMAFVTRNRGSVRASIRTQGPIARNVRS